MNISDLETGWRSNKNEAGGGAIIDMGYHYIDLIVWYFGLPQIVGCRMSGRNREGQNYDVEDTAFLNFTYVDVVTSKKVLGTLFVSRVYSEKNEGLIAHGTNGSVSVTRGKITRCGTDGKVIEELERKDAWPSAIIDQLEVFVDNVRTKILMLIAINILSIRLSWKLHMMLRD